MSRPSLAATIIAKNEINNLKPLFESLKGCVDEIYLTDTGSNDGTVELAKSLGAQVSHFEWVNDFSAARNFNLSQCKTDYALFIDCDDSLENPEYFKLFRDNAMGLSDYWVAPYHYSSDENGKAVCSFARERVFAAKRGLSWKYPIHEGIMPISPDGKQVKAQFIQSWAIRHRRTQEDLVKDRSRNLLVLEGIKNTPKMDSRMSYYYGKELFEAGKIFDAATVLSQVIGKPDLELHDRILGIQYCCYAMISLGQIEKALEIAHQGILLCPNRAEFHNIIADCYIKQGRHGDAIPFYRAAENCQIQAPMAGASPIFFHEDSYTFYPKNQLCRIYMNLGDAGTALSIATETHEKFKDKDSKILKDEIERLIPIINFKKSAKECDDIVISGTPLSGYLWDADVYKEKMLGGSETACVEMAYWLKKLSGRPVKVFNMRDEDKTIDGVEYISNKKITEYMGANKPWLHIAWRHNIKMTDAPTFLWCHDLFTHGGENHENYNKMLALTPFHKNYLMAIQGIPDDKIHVTRNGIRPERFKGQRVKKNRFKFVFPSSPDRGLDRAILVLDEVRKKYPQIELHVHYGIEQLSQYGLGDLQHKLAQMIGERSWIKYHGKTQQDVLIKNYQDTAFWLHPCDFIETSCITAMEMVCSGVYPITRRLGGLADTLADAESKGMAKLLDHDCVTPEQFKAYTDATIQAIEQADYLKVEISPDALSWESVAREWLKDLPEIAYGRMLNATA